MDATTRKAIETLLATNQQMLALLQGEAPAKAAPKAKKAAAPRKAKGVTLTKATRKAFVQAEPRFEGMSTKAIAVAIETGEIPCPKGFRVGAGYKAFAAEAELV